MLNCRQKINIYEQITIILHLLSTYSIPGILENIDDSTPYYYQTLVLSKTMLRTDRMLFKIFMPCIHLKNVNTCYMLACYLLKSFSNTHTDRYTHTHTHTHTHF